MMEEWAQVEGIPVAPSRVAIFADMARAVVRRDGPAPISPLTLDERDRLVGQLSRVGSFDIGDASPRRLAEIAGILVDSMESDHDDADEDDADEAR